MKRVLYAIYHVLLLFMLGAAVRAFAELAMQNSNDGGYWLLVVITIIVFVLHVVLDFYKKPQE